MFVGDLKMGGALQISMFWIYSYICNGDLVKIQHAETLVKLVCVSFVNIKNGNFHNSSWVAFET